MSDYPISWAHVENEKGIFTLALCAERVAVFSFVDKPSNFRVTLPGIARAHALKLNAKIEDFGMRPLEHGPEQ
jgi:hypothetical protein